MQRASKLLLANAPLCLWVNRNSKRLCLDGLEKASRDEITALQNQRLKATLDNVYQNGPHDRQAFDAAGVHPSDFKVLADLAKFPFTSKKDLRANYPFGMFAVPQSQVMRIHAGCCRRRHAPSGAWAKLWVALTTC